MSQHKFKTDIRGGTLEVLAGWDRPLQGFFLVIYFKEGGKTGKLVFSNLDLKESHPKEFDAFRPYLDRYGIVLPSEMIDEIKSDGVANFGNKEVLHKNVNGLYSREQVR